MPENPEEYEKMTVFYLIGPDGKKRFYLTTDIKSTIAMPTLGTFLVPPNKLDILDNIVLMSTGRTAETVKAEILTVLKTGR